MRWRSARGNSGRLNLGIPPGQIWGIPRCTSLLRVGIISVRPGEGHGRCDRRSRRFQSPGGIFDVRALSHGKEGARRLRVSNVTAGGRKGSHASCDRLLQPGCPENGLKLTAAPAESALPAGAFFCRRVLSRMASGRRLLRFRNNSAIVDHRVNYLPVSTSTPVERLISVTTGSLQRNCTWIRSRDSTSSSRA